MTWVAIAAIAWMVLAVGLALLLGRGIALADRAERPASWTDEVEAFLREQTAQGSRPR